MPHVAALYVMADGVYSDRPGVDVWDISRDARTYQGPYPVIAHPPCGPWGNFHQQCKGEGKDCGPLAVAQVRKFGGVLEHPAGSRLWRNQAMLAPTSMPSERRRRIQATEQRDFWGGWTVQVDQHRFGHVALKPTWVYIVGVDVIPGLPAPRSEKPRVFDNCSKRQRMATPAAFADWLIEIAQLAKVGM